MLSRVEIKLKKERRLMSEISEKLGQLRYQSEQHEKRKNHCRNTARNVVKQFKLQGKSLIITVLIDSYFFFRELK